MVAVLEQQDRVIARWWRHLTFSRAKLRHHFPKDQLAHIQEIVAEGERTHRAEIRVVIEGAFSAAELSRRLSPRARAIELFSTLRVWDTEDNCGVLLYILLADRAIEIVADRGIHSRAGNAFWETLVAQLSAAFQHSKYEEGVASVLTGLNEMLTQHYPTDSTARKTHNELADQPVLIL